MRQRPRPTGPKWAALGVIALLVMTMAACGDGETVRTGSGGEDDGRTRGGTEVIDHPSGDEVVLQVARVGGFRPAEAGFSDVPFVTVLGNGTMIVEGAQIEIYPPPILPPLFQLQLSEEGLQAVLRAAREAGLLQEPPDYGRPAIADATTTLITVDAGGQQVTHEIYALTEGAAGPGLTAEQAERREAVSEFVSALAAPEQSIVPPAEVGEAVPYEAERFAIRARPVAPGDDASIPDGIEPEVRDWPLPDVDLGAAYDCLVVDGEGAERLADALKDANTLTRFRQGDTVYTFRVRPLLPPQVGCE